MSYRMCKRMIDRGQTAGLAEKLDIFFAADRLTADQYQELTQLLAQQDKQ